MLKLNKKTESILTTIKSIPIASADDSCKLKKELISEK